jgi:hypothetical protein
MPRTAIDSIDWSQDIAPLLDDHHMVVLSDSAEVRSRFALALRHHLQSQADTTVLEIDGTQAPDIPSFCRLLEAELPPREARVAPSWWRDVHHVIELLTRAPHERRREYLLWRDADVMLEADVTMFGRLVNALFGSAAEREHVSPKPLVLERVIFTGGAKLGAYAEDTHGQFCRWLEDDDADSPVWEVASVLERPPVIVYRIDG